MSKLNPNWQLFFTRMWSSNSNFPLLFSLVHHTYVGQCFCSSPPSQMWIYKVLFSLTSYLVWRDNHSISYSLACKQDTPRSNRSVLVIQSRQKISLCYCFQLFSFLWYDCIWLWWKPLKMFPGKVPPCESYGHVHT